jgi:sulfite exporter TauE/SafE/copper chaperone CopZ
MSRRHPGPPSSTERRSAPPASTPRPGSTTAVAPDLSFRLAVDDVLAQLAAERDGGHLDPRGAAAPAAGSPPAGSPPAGSPLVVSPGAASISTTVPVAGMTCRACEVRIQKQVGRLPDVRRVTASATRGQVVIESTAPIPERAVEKAIRAAGYEIGRTPWLATDASVWLTAVAGLALVFVLATLAQVTGLADLAGGAGDLGQGGLLVALLLGLAAGVSTCMALVGGLVLALSASFQASRTAAGMPDAGVLSSIRPGLVFIAGRIVGYGVLGAALGAVGATVAMPPQLTAVLMIAVAIVMSIVGTRLTGLSPRIATWSPTLPMGLGRQLGLADGAGGATRYSDVRAAGLGAASFFLPCGFTQAVQIYALSTGSPLFAGAIMAVFAIGTAPGLLAMAGLPALVPSGMRPTLLRLVGVVVLGFAFINASAGIQLSGVTLPVFGVDAAAAAPPPAGAPAADGTQQLVTYQDAGGYSPPNVSIYAGVPTRWTIESSNDRTCAIFLVVPSLGIQARLEKGSNVIDLPALQPGELAYSCSMGMYGGRITVVERPTGTTGGDAPGG